jgi:hypothetical protein
LKFLWTVHRGREFLQLHHDFPSIRSPKHRSPFVKVVVPQLPKNFRISIFSSFMQENQVSHLWNRLNGMKAARAPASTNPASRTHVYGRSVVDRAWDVGTPKTPRDHMSCPGESNQPTAGPVSTRRRASAPCAAWACGWGPLSSSWSHYARNHLVFVKHTLFAA